MPALANRALAPGLVVAILAGLHKLLNAAFLVNDDFMHRAYARQLLAGEVPVRDFFDYGMGLMYALSALAEATLGYRLLSEAVLVGLLVGLATFLVYDTVRRVTGSTVAAVLAALLLVVATPRSYAYPKLIVYAAAAWLWWWYVGGPGVRRALVLGLAAGVAFYWRPDHGAYVAIGVALAIVAAHGWTTVTVARWAQSGAVAIAVVAPWVTFASFEGGGPIPFLQSGLTAFTSEHRFTGGVVPRWPIRAPGDLVAVDPPASYAPVVGIRWTADSPADARRAVIERYGLEIVDMRDDRSGHVRLSTRAVRELRALISEPIVEDTDGIDRGAARVSPEEWPASRARRFAHWWLRIRILPALESSRAAGDAGAILLLALPLLAAAGGLLLREHLPRPIEARSLAWFAVFALLVDLGILRTPFNVRVGEAIVLPGITLAVLGVTLFRLASGATWWRRWLVRLAVGALATLVVKALAETGQPGDRVRQLAETSGAWADVRSRLWSSPPIDHWRGRTPEVTLRLATYARDCLPSDDRILVLWFAPEIYYYADRLMASRHAFFLPDLGALPHERAMELDKIRRSPPRMVFVKAGSTREPRETFPELFDLTAGEYRLGGRIEADDDRYDILVRPDRPSLRSYGEDGWPCYRPLPDGSKMVERDARRRDPSRSPEWTGSGLV